MPGAITPPAQLRLDTRLSVADKTVLCDIPVAGTAASAHQEAIAADLSRIYLVGGKCPVSGRPIAIDQWKAAQYGKYTHKTAYPRTAHIYEALSTWTLIRLCILRVNNFANALGHAFLTRLFSIGGLSYAIELGIDMTIMLKSAYKPQSKEQEKLTFSERLSALWQKDNRRARMATAFMWLSINVVTLSITGGAFALVGLFGFFFDIGLELYKYVSVNTQKNLLAKLARRNTEIELERQHLSATHAKPYSADIEARMQALQQEQDIVNSYHPRLIQKIKSEKFSKGKAAVLAILSGVATAIILLSLVFPPTTIPAAVVIVATLTTILAGSVFGGLGPRLMLLGKRAKTALTEKKEVTPPASSSYPMIQQRLGHPEPKVAEEKQALLEAPIVNEPERENPVSEPSPAPRQRSMNP